MGTFSGCVLLSIVCAFAQTVLAAQNDHEPLVAFYCGKPAMHKGVNGWISDKDTTACWDDKRLILDYCQKMYPNHNITNIVEAANLVTINNWPSVSGNSLHTYRVRPYRCIVDNFQSDALLVPQHCKFDHKHDETVCKGFSHWEVQARDACAKDGMHCESFGMLLNCGLGTFSGVEYVCCPNKTPVSDEEFDSDSEDFDDVDDDEDEDSSEDDDDADDEEEEDNSDDDSDDDADAWESKENEQDVDADRNLYELYLKGEAMPAGLHNEHLKYVAARQYMHKLQEAKNTQLMKEWTAARDHVNEVRRNDGKRAEILSKEITDRFKRLYKAYEQEDLAEKEQIVAFHQQHVQSNLNQRKRITMDKYMRSLEKGDVVRIHKNLRNYIKTEEKDIMHSVNHYSHVKDTNLAEAVRIHPHIIQHLKLCQQRMEQALQMLERYPNIERQVRPQIEDFMKKFDDMAIRIRDIVLPDPSASAESSEEDEDSDDSLDDNVSDNNGGTQPEAIDEDVSVEDGLSNSSEDNISDDSFEDSSEEEREDEHDYEHRPYRPANQQHSRVHVQQGLQAAATSSAQLGTTFGIAIGSVAIFVVLVVAVVMLRRRSTPTNITHGYVEVDPAASPEERHVANMQMNGYENPTYRYFEVQTTK